MSADIDVIELDQEDHGARLSADNFHSNITVIVQRKGVTENDIQVALSVLNEKVGAIGAVVIVLMPELLPDLSQTPAARFFVRIVIQVITQPLFNDGETGTGKSAEKIATRIRQLLHFQSYGRPNTFMFDGMEPIPVDAGKVSYGVRFRRSGGDDIITKVVQPSISPESGPAGQVTTLACGTVDASIWYTTDGSYPSSVNPEAEQYTAPFTNTAGGLLRVAAELAGSLPSEITDALFDNPEE